MFSFTQCVIDTCHTYQATGSEYCYRHSPHAKELLSNAYSALSNDAPIRDYCITNAEFEDLQLTNRKEFIASNFAWCTFRNIDFSHAYLTSSFFDFCLFDHCLFKDIDCRYTVFSGSKMISCDFSGSFIVHSNFIGIDALSSNFSSSDLYFSNFSSSFLDNTPFEDCNLKKCDFRFSYRKNVSFKYSNYPEART